MLKRLGSQIVLKARTRPPAQFARTLGLALLNLGNQCRIFRILLHPRFSALAHQYPELFYKYATGGPMAMGLPVAARASCFRHHYSYLLSAFRPEFLDQALHRGFEVFKTHRDGTCLSVVLGLGDPYYNEGELALDFLVAGAEIFNLSFTIVPGKMFGSRAESIILITRIQGVRGRQPENSLAAQELGDVSPPAFLFSVLQGFASAFGIDEFAAVSAVNQTCYTEEFSSSFLRSYDEFLSSLGAILGADGFFRCPVPVPEKPMELVKRDKRVRAKKKRAHKRRIAEDACRVFRNQRDGRIPASSRQPMAARVSEVCS